MDTLLSIVKTINAYLSDYILIILLVGAGLYFTLRTRFVQIRCFGEGMRAVFGKSSVLAAPSSSAVPAQFSGCG